MIIYFPSLCTEGTDLSFFFLNYASQPRGADCGGELQRKFSENNKIVTKCHRMPAKCCSTELLEWYRSDPGLGS